LPKRHFSHKIGFPRIGENLKNKETEDMSSRDFAFALANPMSMILDKPAVEFQRADLLKVIEEKSIERLNFHYTALDGKIKELKIPLTDRRQADAILAEGERVDGSSLFKGMVDTGLSDLYVIPVYKSAFLDPFGENCLHVICRYIGGDGVPAAFTPDNILAAAAALFRKNSGLEIRALGELEFFLLREKEMSLYPAQKQTGYHAAAPFIKGGPILDEILRNIARITGAVKYGHSEVGYIESVHSDIPEIQGRQAEQMEVEFLPLPVEEAADALIVGRWLIRNIAFRNGCTATFTPKIEEGVAGNGLHFHMDLRKNGRNIIAGPDGRLTEDARKLIGGLCAYADSLTAFGNTVSSAYLRLVPHQEAPTSICWSDLNRSALIRVPLGWSGVGDIAGKVNPREKGAAIEKDSRQTIELRSPDGSALIHLVLAGIVMSADWAFRNPPLASEGNGPLDLAERLYVKGNIHKNKEILAKLPSLPSSCTASGRILLEKRSLYERDGVFPPSVIDYVARMLAAEDDEFMNSRLAGLSADDRLHESRRIMHKDLHKH
jgi:glutamine synthetase